MAIKYLLKGRRYFSFQWDNLCFTTEMDVANEGYHHLPCITFANKVEVITHIEEFCNNHPQYLFKVYESKGGIRVFCISHSLDAKSNEAEILHNALKGDPLFWSQCVKQEGYGARISRKKCHGKHDYISRYLFTIGTGNSDPKLNNLTKWYEVLVMIGKIVPII
jgi:hypothetical protein